MSKFIDAKNREWQITIDLLKADDVQQATGVDLYSLFANEFAGFQKLADNMLLLSTVVFTLIHDQAESRQVDAQEFKLSLDGDTLHRMGVAFARAAATICPAAKRETFGKLIDGVLRVDAAETADSAAKIDRAFGEDFEKTRALLKGIGAKEVPAAAE